jgi:hypothetical protein
MPAMRTRRLWRGEDRGRLRALKRTLAMIENRDIKAAKESLLPNRRVQDFGSQSGAIKAAFTTLKNQITLLLAARG